ncbi:hypothetical protein [Idiomarina xiamenensis]|uniref:Uncharacterized protein n=1 Tax=Idiomarina xiamenensis 10-D-4 TaxID=740709 RepID=K2J5F8_9GAMM|nr:hypothetical protein [Idiomarina xiamenensis]EKE78276.1 hypothetical protein A10D4_13376 [Idiomarina xiamenensis 10-D-4]
MSLRYYFTGLCFLFHPSFAEEALINTIASVEFEYQVNSCADFKISYFVSSPNSSVYMPEGTTGLDKADFNYSVIQLNGESNPQMILEKDFYYKKKPDYYIKLDFEESPYVTSVNFEKLFSKLNGDYYLQYFFVKEQIMDHLEKENVDVWLTPLISSERYFVSFDDNGCVTKFFDGKEAFNEDD